MLKAAQSGSSGLHESPFFAGKRRFQAAAIAKELCIKEFISRSTLNDLLKQVKDERQLDFQCSFKCFKIEMFDDVECFVGTTGEPKIVESEIGPVDILKLSEAR